MKRILNCKQFFKTAAFLVLSCVLLACFTSCPNSTGGNNQPGGKSQVKITVRGDNNVTVKTSEFKVDKGEKWETVKKHTAITGIAFKGNFKLSVWKLNNSTGSTLTDSYVFNADTTVFAVSENGGAAPSEEVTITVQGDDNVESGKDVSFKVNKGTKWQAVKTKTEITGIRFKSGFELSEWKLNNAAGSTLTDDYTFNANTTVFAVSKSKGTDKVTITVDGDDDVESGKDVSFEVNKGTKWETVKTKTEITGITFKDGYELSEWKLTNGSGSALTDGHAFNADTTVFAVSKQKGNTPDPAGLVFFADEEGVITGVDAEPEDIPETLVIPAEVNSKTVTGIGSGAFQKFTRIKILDLSNCNGLKTINEEAFKECTNLTEIRFSENLEEIKGSAASNGAFYMCTSLKALDFSNCTKLKKIAGFSKCSAITEIIFPASVTEIGNNAFSECKSLTGTLDLSAASVLEKIEDFAFKNCIKINSINFPASLTEIKGGYAPSFSDCEGLTGVLDLSNCIKLTKVAGFSGCKGITEIKLPATVTEISLNAFSSCSGLTGVLDLSKYGSLKKIAGFNFCENITGVAFPQSAAEINGKAFFNCKKLEGELDLSGTSIEILDEDVFAFTAVTGVKFPAALKKIFKAFMGCKKLAGTLDFSGCSNLTKIEANTFSNCPKVTEIKLPAKIQEIGDKAFSDCKGLTSLDFSSTQLAVIGSEAFADCDGLTSVILPASMREIKGNYGAFYACTKAEITLKEGITTIGDGAFGKADHNFVKSVKVPNEDIKNKVKDSGYPESKIVVEN